MNAYLSLAANALTRAEQRRAETSAALRALRAPDVYLSAKLSAESHPEHFTEYAARVKAATRADETARQAARRARRYYEDCAAALL
jgi:hypothetical protein